ncbi:hypothetical protein [Pseudonocardia sp. GCM10023141]|uniref:hypothetical protein n=1 Tax=Pseudonocardia sp. GCM10023141 TaxID=3252653 RepID=UPI003605D301
MPARTVRAGRSRGGRPVWFRRRARRDDDRQAQQQTSELLDQYHPRASMNDGERMIVAPGKVLENIAFSMERLDTDINTPISIEDDVVAVDELLNLVQNLRMGPTLAVHVVNTALKIMAARYPAELVHNPLPAAYDLRAITPIDVTDREHDAAKSIFNLRTTAADDLDPTDVAAEFADLDVPEQMNVFAALYYMFGTKLGALKDRTGVE